MKSRSSFLDGWIYSKPVLVGIAVTVGSIGVVSAAPLSGSASLLNTNGNGDVGFDGGVRMAADEQGGVVAVWSSTEDLSGAGSDPDIMVSRSSDGGASWSAPSALNNNAGSDSGFDRFPSVASDRLGRMVAVWESNEDLGGAGTDTDVLVSRSLDGGLSWSGPAVLNSNGLSNSGTNFKEPKVTTDGSGVWIACWTSVDDAGLGIGTDQDILYSISTDNGTTWSAAAALNGDAAVDGSAGDFNPAIHANVSGTWVAAWASDEGGSNVMVARSVDGGQSWSGPVGLHPAPVEEGGQDFVPDVHVNEQDQVMVVWESGVDLGGAIDGDQDILFCVSDSGGQSWSMPSAVNTDAGEGDALDSTPSVGGDECGHWVVVWSSEKEHYSELGEDSDILAAHWEDGAASWSPPLPVAVQADQDTGGDTNPEVVINVLGNVVIAWNSNADLGGSGTDGDIQRVAVAKAVFWDAPEVLNGNAFGDNQPERFVEAAGDGQGTMVAVWRGTGGAAGLDGDIYFARSVDEGENWSSPAVVNTNALVDVGSDTDPGVAFMGGDGWLVIWTSDENLGGNLGVDQDILMARSSDGGQTWGSPQALNPDAASDGMRADYDATVASDEAGNLVTVWSSNFGGGDADIAFSRSVNAGVTWSATAALNPGAAGDAGDEFDGTVATGGNGTWIATWFSNNPTGGIGGSLLSDDDLIYRRSIDNGGTWSAGALLNTNGAVDDDEADDMRPSLASDGQGNWVAAWHLEGFSFEMTIGDDTDTLVARSIDDGITWSAPGALHNRSGETVTEFWPRVTTTRNGLWVVAWPAMDFLLGAQDLPGSTPDDTDLLQVMSCDVGLSWTSPSLLNENGLVDSGRDSLIALARASESRLVAVWSSNENLTGVNGTDGDLLVARLHSPNAFRRWLHRRLGCNVFDPVNESTIWGAEADPDGDMLNNVEEYFMGLDPMVADHVVPLTIIQIGPGLLQLEFRRASAAVVGVEAEIEWSEDVKLWKLSGESHSNGSVVTLVPLSPVDQGSYQKLGVQVDVGGVKALYFRLVTTVK